MELRIKQVCKQKGITINTLSERLGISRQALKSRLNNPTAKSIEQIANVLQCEVHELIETSGEYSHFYDTENKEWLGIRKK